MSQTSGLIPVHATMPPRDIIPRPGHGEVRLGSFTGHDGISHVWSFSDARGGHVSRADSVKIEGTTDSYTNGRVFKGCTL